MMMLPGTKYSGWFGSSYLRSPISVSSVGEVFYFSVIGPNGLRRNRTLLRTICAIDILSCCRFPHWYCTGLACLVFFVCIVVMIMIMMIETGIFKRVKSFEFIAYLSHFLGFLG